MKLPTHIMRCLGNDCPIKETCKRYVQRFTNTKPHTPYAIGSPYDHDKGDCDYHIPTQGAAKAETK